MRSRDGTPRRAQNLFTHGTQTPLQNAPKVAHKLAVLGVPRVLIGQRRPWRKLGVAVDGVGVAHVARHQHQIGFHRNGLVKADRRIVQLAGVAQHGNGVRELAKGRHFERAIKRRVAGRDAGQLDTVLDLEWVKKRTVSMVDGIPALSLSCNRQPTVVGAARPTTSSRGDEVGVEAALLPDQPLPTHLVKPFAGPQLRHQRVVQNRGRVRAASAFVGKRDVVAGGNP